MRLSYRQLEEFAVGCETSCVAAGAWCPQRIPSGIAGASDEPVRMAVRRDCTTCVRLRFITDSSRIELSLRLGEAAHPAWQSAIIINGGEPEGFGPLDAASIWRGSVPRRSHRSPGLVDLWLPHLCKAEVVSVELDDGSAVTSAPPLTRRWLAYGDSITQGFVSSLPTHSGIGRCAIALNAAVWNHAVGGSTLHAALAQHPPHGRFDLISIAFGVCDFQENVPLGLFLDRARGLLAARNDDQPGCPIALITPINWIAAARLNELGLSIQDYREGLAAVAGEFRSVLLVPGEALVPQNSRYFEDWIHPNDRGFAHYADNLLPYLRRALSLDPQRLTPPEAPHE